VKKIAFLFPGQGSQAPKMGKDFADSFSIAKQTFEEANDVLGRGLSKIIFEGPESDLTLTKNSQTAIFVVSVAIARVLMQQMPQIQPSVCSGLSLGEYTALWGAHRISFEKALLLVQKRADLMNEACEKNKGTMAAVLGMEAGLVEKALYGIDGVWIANYNCPGQIVISGTVAGVENGSIALKNAGARRVLPLHVHGAFHSGLMKSAQEGLSPFLESCPLLASKTSFVMNVPGDFVSDETKIRDYLKQQVTCSVRWEQGVLAMDAAGVDEYIEVGFGKTLLGLNKKMNLKAASLSVGKVEDLETLACSC
jgi:[acyl-carrier-protein] S-malonyltransferase